MDAPDESVLPPVPTGLRRGRYSTSRRTSPEICGDKPPLGRPESGEVADWIYVSSQFIHALVFGLEPHGSFGHSPESPHRLRRRRASLRAGRRDGDRQPGDGRGLPRRRPVKACSSAVTPGITPSPTANGRSVCSSCLLRPLRPEPPVRTPGHGRISTEADTPDERAARSASPPLVPIPQTLRRLDRHDLVWRRDLGVLVGLYASTEHLTVGVVEVDPGQSAAVHAHGETRSST